MYAAEAAKEPEEDVEVDDIDEFDLSEEVPASAA